MCQVKPLCAENPIWQAVSEEPASAVRKERAVITVAIHGNEPCGVHAANELLLDGTLGFMHGMAPWPPHLLSFTLMLGNPEAFSADKRFLDSNLNRALTQEGIHAADAAAGRDSSSGLYTCSNSTDSKSSSEAPIRIVTPPHSNGINGCGAHLGVEKVRAAKVAAVISGATMFVDIHSTSAAAAAFAFHAPSQAAQDWAATFAVGFTIEDTSLIGTTFDWAARQGIDRAALVECGQHKARTSVDIAKRAILRIVTGQAAEMQPVRLRNAGSVMVCHGFRFSQKTPSFHHVAYQQLIAQDEEHGDIRCPQLSGAYIVMPTEEPVHGEEAWVWGVPFQ